MNIGDYVRSGLCYLDELFIESAGRPFIHTETGTQLMGMYELPPVPTLQVFGIDDPNDEMQVEVGFETTKKKLGDLPPIAARFNDFTGGKWIVVQRNRKDDQFRGQNRLVLTCCRYHESVSTPPPVPPLYREDK